MDGCRDGDGGLVGFDTDGKMNPHMSGACVCVSVCNELISKITVIFTIF